jgi:catechol 2,3-dioxygenase-like lactoylglutathione lyase family enzyme
MGLMSVRLGTNDIAKARSFYDALFAALGLGEARVAMEAPIALYRLPGGLHFTLAAPRDGRPATHGNGDTVGFSAPDAAAVDRWHAAGLRSGGTCEGPPGVRQQAGGRYGAYLRDPDGHKLCVYAPTEPRKT